MCLGKKTFIVVIVLLPAFYRFRDNSVKKVKHATHEIYISEGIVLIKY